MRGIDKKSIPQPDNLLTRFADRHPKWDQLDRFLFSLPPELLFPLLIVGAIVCGLILRANF